MQTELLHVHNKSITNKRFSFSLNQHIILRSSLKRVIKATQTWFSRSPPPQPRPPQPRPHVSDFWCVSSEARSSRPAALCRLLTYIFILKRAYLRVQQHPAPSTGHIWAGDGCPPALHDGQLDILLQTLQRERRSSYLGKPVPVQSAGTHCCVRVLGD